MTRHVLQVKIDERWRDVAYPPDWRMESLLAYYRDAYPDHDFCLVERDVPVLRVRAMDR